MTRLALPRPGAVALTAAIAFAAALPLAAEAPASIRAPRATGLSVQGTDFRLTLPDGRVLRGADMVGASLLVGAPGPDGRPQGVAPIRIAAAMPDPRDRRKDDATGQVWLFDLRAPDGAPVCSPDPDGQQLGFPVAEPGNPARFTLTCTSGTVGKCIRMGYAPWRTAPDGRSLEAWHSACSHLLRAEYGQDGAGHTTNGTKIELYDDIGIEAAETGARAPFEAGFGPNGAVCVAHSRIPENITLDAIKQRYPALAANSGPEHCTEDRARALGALVFVRSASKR